MVRIICLIIGYVFGLFQTSYIYGRLQGFDIKNSGSGNYGTTNMLRTKGVKAGVIVLLCDAFKCVFAVLFVYLLFGKTYADIFPLLKVYAGAGVILGHNYPFYLKFKGGKGIAATAGLIISMGPIFFATEFVMFFGTFFLTHYVSLGSLLVYALLVIQTVIMGQLGCFGMDVPHLCEMYVIIVLLAAMAYWKHRENIKRLVSGTERKTYLKKKSDE